MFSRFLSGRGQKWPWIVCSWDTKICCILKINLWIELVFWMLIVMQWFLVRLISSLTFKCQESAAVVLLVIKSFLKEKTFPLRQKVNLHFWMRYAVILISMPFILFLFLKTLSGVISVKHDDIMALMFVFLMASYFPMTLIQIIICFSC